MAHLDFELGLSTIAYSPVENFSVGDMLSQTISLSPSTVPTGNGVSLLVLGIRFFQEVNQTQYVLANGQYNALAIVGIQV
jgi:hypothetical protein